jgi:hypothetical protein
MVDTPLFCYDPDAFAIIRTPRRKEVIADLHIICRRFEQLQIELVEEVTGHQPASKFQQSQHFSTDHNARMRLT